MLRFVFLSAVLQCIIAQQYQQKVAPGVPPQNYQQQQYQPPPPPPPQQQQYQQQQYQPPPPQQQQFQQQVPVQQQQVPMQQQQHGHAHNSDPQLLNPANIREERDHIQEHMEVPLDTSKMTEEELQFHYFKMHDADNNNKLDGCELIKSLIHWHDEAGGGVDNPASGHDTYIYKDQDLEEIVNGALKQTDLNNDGFIEYAEFKKASGMPEA